MAENPLQILEKLAPELLKAVGDARALALNEGALPRKIKLLLAMALDASEGAVEGVRSLTELALKEGATKEEVMDALGVANYICGVGCVYTAARAFKDLF